MKSAEEESLSIPLGNPTSDNALKLPMDANGYIVKLCCKVLGSRISGELVVLDSEGPQWVIDQHSPTHLVLANFILHFH